jgi:hypothetical protein
MQTLKDLWRGVSCTLISYGGSQTGKSYSLFGTPSVLEPSRVKPLVSDGLVPRLLKRLFALGTSRPAPSWPC